MNTSHSETSTFTREYGFDNIRGILIICVVLGHLLEISPTFLISDILYRIIYSFHMPAFLFLFGYFCHYNPKRIVSNWVIPYFLFQTAYILFSRTVLDTDLSLQYTTPYWLLWYMLACIFYQLLIPLYDTDSNSQKLLTLIICFLLALLVGFDTTIGYYATLSRFFVFQPWFVLGLYIRKSAMEKSIQLPTQLKLSHTIFILVSVCISVIGICRLQISGAMLYGSYSYEQLPYSAVIRAVGIFASFSWISFFVYIIRILFNKKITLLTSIGQNTLPIFILHGFIIKAIPLYAPTLLTSPRNVFISTILIVLLFGNPFFGKCFKTLFSCKLPK